MDIDKNLQRFIDDKTSDEEADALLEVWITKTKDAELRTEASSILQKDYGLGRNPKKGGKLKYLRPLLVAASLALLFSMFFINRDDFSATELAAQYVDTESLTHPGNSKGVTELDTNRTRAIVAFNNTDFNLAIVHFNQIKTTSEEDKYYLGLAYMKSGQIQQAIDTFEEVGERNDVRFRQEINWFLALSHLLNGNTPKATESIKNIQNGDWKYDDAQKLLHHINK
ncbi:tetratricopeptide repeat protein [Poritiphilus flavus]|uniref:Tetratricopeptide repeat-containing protein n=1 Tax=Poritiphilus flavus TaxID=2697053 RepID=A0A6L9EAZ8_9FLAO|nr:hypothetical protein [Poritiphilus flavus]NAS11854.1 hypothetical protein [Poritiphilus flavus]